MRNSSRSLYLYACSHRELFDFDYNLLPDFKEMFEEAFYDFYYFHNISFDSYNMFKQKLRARLNLLAPKYNKLYASENLISNPFINTVLEVDDWNRSKAKFLGLNSANLKANSSNFGESNLVSHNIGGDKNLGEENKSSRVNDLSKNKGIENTRNTNTNIFADTPQSSISENTFNSGYITTKTSVEDKKGLVNSNVSEVFRDDNTSATHSNININTNFSDTSNQDKSVGNTQQYTDSISTTGEESTNKNLKQVYGIKDTTLSNALIEFRETFIAITQQLINELYDLFMLVY